MRRRHLLTSVAALGLAGCTAIGNRSPDQPDQAEVPAGGRTTDDPATPGRSLTEEGSPDPVTVEPGEALALSDPDAWDVLEGTASVAGSCAEGSEATCLRLERGPKRSRIARRFERPHDLTGVRPSAALTASESTYPRIRLFDVAGDELRLRTPVRGGLDFQPFNFGIERVVGEPDLSQIVEIRFNQGGSPTVELGSLTFHEPLPPMVLLAFGDDYAKNHPEAFSSVREYDLPATVFVNTGPIGGVDQISVGQLKTLKREGWDVCNYTTTNADLPTLDEDGQRRQIVGGRRWLILNGFEEGAEYFAYPYSNYDQTSIDIVSRWNRLAFAGGFPAAGALPNRQLVPRSDVGGPEDARRMIDLTARYGGVTCLFYHALEEPDERELQQTVEYLDQRASAGDVEIATASELDARLGS